MFSHRTIASLFLLLVLACQGCGLEVVSSHGSSHHLYSHDHIFLKLTHDVGYSTKLLTNECIDLDSDGDGSIRVRNYEEDHNIDIDWHQGYEFITFEIYEDYELFFDETYRSRRFRYGEENSIELAVRGDLYRLDLSGPNCY